MASVSLAAGLPSISSSSSSSSSVSYSSIGFRSANKLDLLSSSKASSLQSKTRSARSMARTTCLETSLVISLCTATALSLGRFVFLPFQREQQAKVGLPRQNGVPHYEAGDTRAKEYVSLLKSNDPSGFNIVDVLAWGSLGHIAAYWILATASNGYDPKFW